MVAIFLRRTASFTKRCLETPPKFVKYVTNIQQMWLKNNYVYIVLTFHDVHDVFPNNTYMWLFTADNYHFLLDWFSHIPDENHNQ